MEVGGGPRPVGGGKPEVQLYEWGALAVGALLLVAAAVGYVGSLGATYKKSLVPQYVMNDAGEIATSRSSTEPIELKPGRYNLRVGVRYSTGGLGMSLKRGARFHYKISCAELAWSDSGSLGSRTKKKKKKKRSGSRYDSSTHTVKVAAPGTYTFAVDMEGKVDKKVDFAVRSSPFDYRLPLIPGLLLVVGTIAASPGLRGLATQMAGEMRSR